MGNLKPWHKRLFRSIKGSFNVLSDLFGQTIHKNKNHGWNDTDNLAKNNEQCKNKKNEIKKNKKDKLVSSPFLSFRIILIHDNKNIALEIISTSNGTIICRYHRDKHQQYKTIKVDKNNNIYIYTINTNTLLFNNEISKIQCVFDYILYLINSISSNFTKYQYQYNLNESTQLREQLKHEINHYLNDDQHDDDSDDSDDSDDDPYDIYEDDEELDKMVNELNPEDLEYDEEDKDYLKEDKKEIEYDEKYKQHEVHEVQGCNDNDNDGNKNNTEYVQSQQVEVPDLTQEDIYQIHEWVNDIIFGGQRSHSRVTSINYIPFTTYDPIRYLYGIYYPNNGKCHSQQCFVQTQQRMIEPSISSKSDDDNLSETEQEEPSENEQYQHHQQQLQQQMYEQVNENEFGGVYLNNEQVVKGENDAMDDSNYAIDPNIEDEANGQINPAKEVDHYIRLDISKMYDNILHFDGKPNSFDAIYANDNDNVFILKENKLNNNQNNDTYPMDDDDDDDGSDIEDDDEENEIDKQYEYDEQKEGHIEVIDEKTYIFPREYKNIGPVFSYGKNWSKEIVPKYAHLKEEVLNNKYAPITEKTWNGILKKCNKILKGEFSSKRKNRWSKLLRDNKIGMKHLVALKLYTDFDLLQREFRKSFRAPYNKKKERLQAFYHWREALQETFKRFSDIPSALNQPNTLFHGINSIMCLDQYEGIYYGPCSTTTDLHVARSFAGKNGMILVMKPETDLNNTAYKVLDISWISDYPDEREYLLFDHKIEIETWILSTDYDQYYHYYHNTLTKKKVIKGPSGHLSYQNQKKIPKHLTKLKLLIDEVEIKPNKNENGKKAVKIKQNVEFAKDCLCDQDKIDLLIWMFQFALGYKYGKKKPSKYDQSLNANIQHVMKQIHIMQVPPKLVTEFMEQLRVKYRKEMSAYFIRSVLNEYFINTYCPLDASIDSAV